MVTLDRNKKTLEFANMVVSRLEKLSVDSLWARRASGTRRELVRLIEKIQTNIVENVENDYHILADIDQLKRSIDYGLVLLKNAAKEIPDTDYYRKG